MTIKKAVLSTKGRNPLQNSKRFLVRASLRNDNNVAIVVEVEPRSAQQS